MYCTRIIVVSGGALSLFVNIGFRLKSSLLHSLPLLVEHPAFHAWFMVHDVLLGKFAVEWGYELYDRLVLFTVA